MKNTIQVFGLPRSGTNFLEWSIVEYFDDIIYENKYQICDVEGLNKYDRLIALKHSYPSLDNSNYVIVIYKDFEKWSKSYKKWSKKLPKKEIWEKYLKKSNEIDVKRCLLISHDELFSNYKEILIKISRKFNLQLKNKPIIKPEGYFNKEGAKSQPIKNKKYKHE
jgi:hypothetical protein